MRNFSISVCILFFLVENEIFLIVEFEKSGKAHQRQIKAAIMLQTY